MSLLVAARLRRSAIAALTRCAALIAAGSLLLAGCSRKIDGPAPPPASAPQSAAATAADGPGQVTGKAPAPNAGGAVVVVLEPTTERTFAPQTEKPVMDQVGQTFGPEVLIVRTGQPVEFRNSDDTLHNVHVSHDETREPAFNVAIPTGESYSYTFRRDGFYRVGCDIHPSMAATIYSTASPFATLAAADGRFAFADVPQGTWKLSVFAAGRRLEREVDVRGGVTDATVQ